MTICTCKRQTSFLSPWINDLNVFMQGSFHIIEPPVWLWTWLWPLRLQPRPTTTTTHEWPTVTHLPDWVWNWYRSERPAYCWRLLQRLPWSSDRLSRLSITAKNLTFLHDPLPGSLRHSKQDQATRPEAHLEDSREDSVESRRTTATPNSSSFPHAIPEDVQFFEPSLVKLIMSHFERIIIYKLIRRFHLLQCHMWATKMNTTLGFFFSQVVLFPCEKNKMVGSNCSISFKAVKVTFLGAVHLLRNTNSGSWETPPPLCNIVINWEDPPPM